MYDPRAPSDRQLNNDSKDKLTSKLSLLVPNSCYFGFHDRQSTPVATEAIDPLVPSAFSNFYDIAAQPFKEMMDTYCQNLAVSSEDIAFIEKVTLGQSSNEEWIKQRKYRITASNFYSAAVSTTEPSSKLKSMFYSSFHSSSTEHGKKFERHVRDMYQKAMQENGSNVVIDEVGLKLSSNMPYLGASLDGLVSCHGEVWGLEIKCPFSKYNSSLSDALVDKKFFLQRVGGKVHLKQNHKYFTKSKNKCFVLT